jgi:hypothetical protein
MHRSCQAEGFGCVTIVSRQSQPQPPSADAIPEDMIIAATIAAHSRATRILVIVM